MLDNETIKKIVERLPDEVLTFDVNNWRVPTSNEIRVVVGKESLTGISGAKAARIVGVYPSNFRKYTAKDGSRTQQKISYAAWHLLLLKIGVIKYK